MDDLPNDFLGGRLRIWQPVRGYRAGADAVMLAAACPARPGQAVLELGCGVGTALFCLGARVGGLRLTGVEIQPDYAELARRNASENAIAARILTGDLADMPAPLRHEAFDHVIANPPYFLGGTLSPDGGRETARHETVPLALWIDTGLRRLRPGGVLVLIQQAERLPEILTHLHGKAGEIAILPIAARAGRAAGRVIVKAKKGARSPATLLAPFVMHEKPAHDQDVEDLTARAQAVLREGQPINLCVRESP